MLDQNSHLGFYSKLLELVYCDTVVSDICPQSERDRDLSEMKDRLSREGMGFLTKTLPRLGKALDASLASGTRLTIPNFKLKKGTQLPQFMWTLFSLIFDSDGMPLQYGDPSSGPLEGNQNGGACSPERRETLQPIVIDWVHRRESAVIALRALRQVCGLFYKLELPYTREQEDQVIQDFKATDASLEICLKDLSFQEEQTIATARKIILRVLANSCPYSGSPRHGPGAVATGEKSPEKHIFKRYYRRLMARFPLEEWLCYNSSHLCDSLQEFLALEELEAGTAKVVLVPKDSRGPRLISCEPLEYQWVQQSVKNVLVDVLESHPLTKGFVNFTDQTVNRDLALEGSQGNYPFVTLDMKEASDRVSLELVERLFPKNWYEALYACRTPSTKLPDGTIVHMKKFAPMGSAVCFPVEAFVFWALSVARLVNKRSSSPGRRLPEVYVYGDDVICRREDYPLVSNTLSRFGLCLNQQKCCVYGPFKESCGMDAFLGRPVAPVRMHRTWSHNRKSGDLATHVAFSNALWEAGYTRAAEYIESELSKNWKGLIPTLPNGDIGVIAFVRDHVVPEKLPSNRIRFNKALHRREVRGFRVSSPSVKTDYDGWPLILRTESAKMKVERGSIVYTPSVSSQLDTGHYALAMRARLKLAWTPLSH